MNQYLENENDDENYIYVNIKNSYVYLWKSNQNLRLFFLGALFVIALK